MGILADKLGKHRPSQEDVDKLVADLVKRIVQNCDPLAIYVFGSAANYQMTYSSDLDLCLIFADRKISLQAKTIILSQGLLRDYPIDLLFFDQAYFEAKKDLGGICFEIFHYGRSVYKKGPVHER